MVERKQIGTVGLLVSGVLILIGIVNPQVAGVLAELIPITGIQLVIPLPNLGDLASLLSERGWVGHLAAVLVAAFLTLATLNLASRITDRLQAR